MPVHSDYAWCPQCNDLVAAEYLPDMASLQRSLSDVESNGLDDDERDFAALIEATAEQLLADRISMWRNYISWRSIRQSPPRCLRCGTTDIQILTTPLRHPNCGGNLQIESSGDYLPAGPVHYDAEGNRIGDSAVT